MLNPHDNDYKGVILFISWRGKWSKREFINIMRGKDEKVTGYIYFVGKFIKAGGIGEAKNTCLDAPQDIRFNQTELHTCNIVCMYCMHVFYACIV